MAADEHTTEIARTLRRGIEVLRRGDAALALPHLKRVVEDVALEAATDLQDVRARACSLLAQAQLQLGQLDGAQNHANRALDLLRAVGDPDGIREVEQLRAEIADAAQKRAEQERRQRSLEQLARTEVAVLRERYERDPVALAEILLKKSSAEIEAGRPVQARAIAEEVLDLACEGQWLRQEVLARLCLARVHPTSAPDQLLQAWRRAERASDHTLVATVARAAELAGLELPHQLGPQMRPPGEE